VAGGEVKGETALVLRGVPGSFPVFMEEEEEETGGNGGTLPLPLVFLSFSLRGEGGDSLPPPPPAPPPPVVVSALILCFFTLSDQDLSLTCTPLTGN
jgi:hypothetical protein